MSLCSHLLFSYSEQLSASFHAKAIQELCRVAGEVRIFPLLEMGTKPSRHLKSVSDSLATKGYEVCFTTVDYEFQPGGNGMMTIKVRPDGG